MRTRLPPPALPRQAPLRRTPRPWATSSQLGALINLTYAAVVIHGLANPQGRVGTWVSAWVRFTRRGLEPAYRLAGHADCGGGPASPFVNRAWTFDVHLVTVNLIVAAVLFATSRRYWPAWSRQVLDQPSWRDIPAASRRQEVEIGFGTVLWGAIAALWWLVLENDLFDSAAHCAAVRPWLLYRAPLLAISAHGLASLAAALWAGQPHPAED